MQWQPLCVLITAAPLAVLLVALLAVLLVALYPTSARADDIPAPAPAGESSRADALAYAAPTPRPPEQTRAAAEPPNPTPIENWNVHGQISYVAQMHPGFSAAYSGPNSLNSSRDSAETVDATLFLGVRLWRGAAFYANPEVDQGFGLSNTLGVAGFPSGAAYKVGQNTPYAKLPRAFLRQVIALDGPEQAVPSAPNQLAGVIPVNNVTITIGKFAVVDIFDTNTYAHDPRADFLNWSIIEAGAFDYAADAWGYTFGAAVEWTQSWWTVRGGFFDLSNVPNSTKLDSNFSQYEWVGELEARHVIAGHPGKLKVLAFVNQGNMGRYNDAVALGQQTGTTPDTSQVRRFASRLGFAINAEQELAAGVGAFARFSMNDGSEETFEFTDINQSISGGLSLAGDLWGRHGDGVGMAFVVNGLSGDARRYFEAGGLGVLVGDGALRYGTERIAEIYYHWAVLSHLSISLNFQYVMHPGYNRDRGPVPVIATRIHAEF